MRLFTDSEIAISVTTNRTGYNASAIAEAALNDSPLNLPSVSGEGPIRCRNVLGGIIGDYYRAAA